LLLLVCNHSVCRLPALPPLQAAGRWPEYCSVCYQG
jgi:hypothetical protein